MTKDEITAQLRTILVEMFEVDPAAVVPSADLYDHLDIDSIDAVDLIVKLRDLTGRKIEPEQFKDLRTVADVVDAIDQMLR